MSFFCLNRIRVLLNLTLNIVRFATCQVFMFVEHFADIFVVVLRTNLFDVALIAKSEQCQSILKCYFVRFAEPKGEEVSTTTTSKSATTTTSVKPAEKGELIRIFIYLYFSSKL